MLNINNIKIKNKMKRKAIVFKDHPEFRPNISPQEMFEAGIFGGTYWRPIHSSVTGRDYRASHKKPRFNLWWKGIPEAMLSSSVADKTINKYKVWSGTSLEYWESKGWIEAQDPYGWVQWYCEFYAGRRSPDDDRQIARWLAFAGPHGRFRVRLINMCHSAGKKFADESISPVIRQGLLQWAFTTS
jgi:hypothetical protein